MLRGRFARGRHRCGAQFFVWIRGRIGGVVASERFYVELAPGYIRLRHQLGLRTKFGWGRITHAEMATMVRASRWPRSRRLRCDSRLMCAAWVQYSRRRSALGARLQQGARAAPVGHTRSHSLIPPSMPAVLSAKCTSAGRSRSTWRELPPPM